MSKISFPPFPTSASLGPKARVSRTRSIRVRTSPTSTFTPGLRNAPPVRSSHASPRTTRSTRYPPADSSQRTSHPSRPGRCERRRRVSHDASPGFAETCDDRSSAAISCITSANSERVATRGSTPAYVSRIPFQSARWRNFVSESVDASNCSALADVVPERVASPSPFSVCLASASPNAMRGSHQSSRNLRHVSPNICAHSFAGSTTILSLPSRSRSPDARSNASSSTSSPSLSSSSGFAPALYALSSVSPDTNFSTSMHLRSIDTSTDRTPPSINVVVFNRSTSKRSNAPVDADPSSSSSESSDPSA